MFLPYKGNYGVYTSAEEHPVLYKATKHTGMKQRYSAYTTDDVCVCKAKQTDKWGKVMEFEFAAGALVWQPSINCGPLRAHH